MNMSGENSRDFILNTACQLFSEKGYDAVGVQEICEKSGITKPTLYYFFGSKKGLLKALADEKGEILYNSLRLACTYKHDFFNSMMDTIKAEIIFAKENPEYFRLHGNLMHAPVNSESGQCYSELKTKLNALILEFISLSSEEFGNMRSKEHLYSTLFHNNLITVAGNVLEGIIEENDEAIYKITHSFIYGFAD